MRCQDPPPPPTSACKCESLSIVKCSLKVTMASGWKHVGKLVWLVWKQRKRDFKSPASLAWESAQLPTLVLMCKHTQLSSVLQYTLLIFPSILILALASWFSSALKTIRSTRVCIIFDCWWQWLSFCFFREGCYGTLICGVGFSVCFGDINIQNITLAVALETLNWLTGWGQPLLPRLTAFT